MKVRKYIPATVLLTGVAFAISVFAQSRGTPSTLRVRIDANGALVTAAAAQVNPVTSVQFNNARLAVDASGNLLTVISGGSGVGTVTSVATTGLISGGPITTTGTIACALCASTSATLGQFASTNSATFAGVLSDETGFTTGALAVFNTSPTFLTSIIDPLVIGGTGTTSTLTLQPTSGVGTTGADIIFKVGNNGATEAGRFVTSSNNGLLLGVASTQTGYGTQPLGNIHAISTVSGSIITDRISADAVAGVFLGRHARGTINALGQTVANDNLVTIQSSGWETTTPAWTAGSNGQFGIQATESYTSTAQGTKYILNITPTGSVTPARILTITTAGMIFSQNSGTAMAVANVGANSCGSGTATIAGNQTVGEVTVSTGGGTQCRVTVPQATTTRFAGSCSNQTTANLCRVVHVSTTQFDLVGTFNASDVVAYFIASR